jgi:hypothetical protein
VANGHLFLLFQAAPPLIILFVHRFLTSDRVSPRWTGLWIGACYVVQFFVSTEEFACLVVMTLLASVVGLVFARLTHTELQWARLGRMGGVAVAVVALGAGFGAWTALAGPNHVHGPVQSATAIAGMSTDPVGLVAPTLDQRFTFGHDGVGNSLVAARDADWKIVFESPVENGTYLGVPLVVGLAVIVVALRRRRLVQFSAVMAGAALVLSMGTVLHVDGHRTGVPLPFDVIAHLPLFNSSVAARWIVYFWVFAALLVALGVDAVAEGVARRSGRLGALAAAALVSCAVLLPLVPAWPYASAAATVPPWFTGAGRHVPVGSSVVVYPESNPMNDEAMVWQAMANMRFKMPGGYAIFTNADGTASFSPQPTLLQSVLSQCEAGGAPDLPPAVVHAQLGAVDASAVVVVPGQPGSPCAAAIFTKALGQPEHTQGVLEWRA